MATVTAGNSYSQSVSADQTVAISVAHNSSGRIKFTPINAEGLPVDAGTGIGFGPLAMSKTFGPWGQAGTVTIYCDVGTVTYTVAPPTFYDNPVVNGGTANGVAYLNGSKVLTTGSGLTFDGSRLDVNGIINNGSAIYWANGVGKLQFSGSDAYIDSTGSIIFRHSGSTEGMRLTGVGLGLGVSNPICKLDISGSVNLSASATIGWGGSTDYCLQSDNANWFRILTAGSERFRVTSVGDIQIGGFTSIPVAARTNGVAIRQTGFSFRVSSGNNDWGISTTSGVIAYLYSDNGSASVYAGSIGVNGNTASYNSVSDYRLKENVEPMQNALATVAKLKPVTYTWKEDGSAGQGFIAHELQAVVPDAVTGEKDATRIEQYVVEPEKKVKVTKQRQVTDKTLVNEEQIVLIDGKHVLRMVEKVVDQPLFEVQPAVDEAGNPVMVMVSPEVRDEKGNVTQDAVFQQRTVAIPVMEEYEDEETVPAVMGEREVPDYQGVDTSFLVATLTAAIQELTQQVNTLKAKVGA